MGTAGDDLPGGGGGLGMTDEAGRAGGGGGGLGAVGAEGMGGGIRPPGVRVADVEA